MPGPYETERKALADAAEVYDAMRSKRGQVHVLNLAVLEEACTAAKVELGEYDRSVIVWLAGFEPQQTQVVAELIRRAAKL